MGVLSEHCGLNRMILVLEGEKLMSVCAFFTAVSMYQSAHGDSLGWISNFLFMSFQNKARVVQLRVNWTVAEVDPASRIITGKNPSPSVP
jgi:hypothetical protein